MQLSEKDKQALQEKYKEQRQKMWSGKQSTSQESEEKTAEVDQGDAADNTPDLINTVLADTESDSSSTAADQPAAPETVDGEPNQDEPSVQTESEDETAPIAEETGEQAEAEEEEAGTGADERVFWEASEQEGGPIALTWKLVLAVIGVAVILVGVGVYLGFLFAG